MQRFVQRVWHDDSGQDMIEYALLAALVATGSAILLPTEVYAGIVHIFSKVTVQLERFGNGGG